MTLYEIIQQRGIEAIGRFYSTYRGIVITSNDPDSQNKVCVHLPSILRGVEVWAYPKHQQGGPGSGFAAAWGDVEVGARGVGRPGRGAA